MIVQTEFIRFRIFRMPCCEQLLCWVNPRLPNHCPECGERIFLDLKHKPEYTVLDDGEAQLRHH